MSTSFTKPSETSYKYTDQMVWKLEIIFTNCGERGYIESNTTLQATSKWHSFKYDDHSQVSSTCYQADARWSGQAAIKLKLHNSDFWSYILVKPVRTLGLNESYNISAWTTQKTVFLLLCAFMLQALPSNGRCLPSHYLAMGLYATLLPP
jgi:hypothetical protein